MLIFRPTNRQFVRRIYRFCVISQRTFCAQSDKKPYWKLSRGDWRCPSSYNGYVQVHKYCIKCIERFATKRAFCNKVIKQQAGTEVKHDLAPTMTTVEKHPHFNELLFFFSANLCIRFWIYFHSDQFKFIRKKQCILYMFRRGFYSLKHNYQWIIV